MQYLQCNIFYKCVFCLPLIPGCWHIPRTHWVFRFARLLRICRVSWAVGKWQNQCAEFAGAEKTCPQQQQVANVSLMTQSEPWSQLSCLPLSVRMAKIRDAAPELARPSAQICHTYTRCLTEHIKDGGDCWLCLCVWLWPCHIWKKVGAHQSTSDPRQVWWAGKGETTGVPFLVVHITNPKNGRITKS